MSGVRKSERGESRLEAQKCKLTVHPNKTHIAKLDEPFKHLQISYRLTETGKLVKRINPEAVTRERHRLKAYKRLLMAGRMSDEEVENAFKSWMVLNYKVMKFSKKYLERRLHGKYHDCAIQRHRAHRLRAQR